MLIANADDLGLSNVVDDGILFTADHGIVRSASLLVTSSRAPAALRAARSTGLSVGLHLNASQPEIVARAHQSLARTVSHHMRLGISLGTRKLESVLSFFDQQVDVFGQLSKAIRLRIERSATTGGAGFRIPRRLTLSKVKK